MIEHEMYILCIPNVESACCDVYLRFTVHDLLLIRQFAVCSQFSKCDIVLLILKCKKGYFSQPSIRVGRLYQDYFILVLWLHNYGSLISANKPIDQHTYDRQLASSLESARLSFEAAHQRSLLGILKYRRDTSSTINPSASRRAFENRL